MSLPTTKRELAQALLDGRRFKDPNGRMLVFDGDGGDTPFRAGRNTLKSLWNNIHILTEIKEWCDYIPEEGVLCWVWDEYSALVPGLVVKYLGKDAMYPYEVEGGGSYDYATPVTPEECYQHGET